MFKADEEGFTLVQLIAALASVLVLMTMVVPALEHMTRRADETEAIESLRTLNQMEGQYAEDFPQVGFTCSLAELGGDAKAGAPSPAGAQLITKDLAAGSKAGYRFTVSSCVHGMSGGREVVVGYGIAAVPERPGKTGQRGFCTSQDAHLAADPNGGTNCTELLKGSSPVKGQA